VIRVELLDADATVPEWRDYVTARATAATDLPAWRDVLRDAYGTRAHTLCATEDGRVVGALTLFEIRHPVFGHYLASAAFGTDGGLFSDSDEAREALAVAARAFADQKRVASLVVRTRGPALAGYATTDRFRTSVLTLDADAKVAFDALPSKTRNQIRRGTKEGFAIATGPGELVAFHDVFHRHMRELGSPAHGRRFYEAVLRHLAPYVEFYVVRDGAELAAGALVFRVNGTAANYHTVSLRQYNRRCVNYLLYWRMIEDAIAQRCRAFDMGRSEANTSQLAFKENWEAREIPLHYEFYRPGGGSVPDLSPRNPKYRLAIEVWRRLPLVVTRALGPHVISGIA